MKSVIISTAYPLRGGIAQSNEGLSRAMNKAGIKNHIISFKFLYPSFFFPNKSFKEVGKGSSDLKISSEISSINPLTWFSVASKIKKEKPDFVVIRYWVPFLSPALGTIARLIKLNTKIKVICLVDQVYPHERRFVDDILAGYTLGSGDAFIVFSKSVEKKLIDFAKGKKIVQTPLPLYTAFGKKISKLNAKKRLGLQKDNRVLLFFGFIRHYKGLDLLIKALAEPKVRK
ncbi:MAG: glycosyl transferase family 1, partial [Nanoarchaeota archaeon]